MISGGKILNFGFWIMNFSFKLNIRSNSETALMDYSSVDTIVIDAGSDSIKAGFAGESSPATIFKSVVGMPKYDRALRNGALRNRAKDHNVTNKIYVGSAAFDNKSILKLEYPIRRAIVQNWDHMESIFNLVFENLRVEPQNKSILLSEAARNPIKNKETMIQTMFELYNVQNAYVAPQCILSLYGVGKTTGLSVDIGSGVTQIAPIYDGYKIDHAIDRYDLAGQDITEYAQRLLELEGHRLKFETVQIIKEKYSKAQSYVLPDNTTIYLKDTIHLAPQILFDPSLIGLEFEGIHLNIVKSINKTSIDARRELYDSVVLSGGSTLYKNLEDSFINQLNRELINVIPPSIKLNILQPENPLYVGWIGGSVLSSLSSFRSAWIDKQEYLECGAKVFARCL